MLKSIFNKIKVIFSPMLSSLSFLNRFFLISILILYISISHIVLPATKKTDFLFFFTWTLFHFMPMENIHDITWDKGQSFLFRDHKQKAKDKDINLNTLFYFVISNKHAKAKKNFLSKLIKLCECENIYLYQLKGTLSEHIIYKKQLKILRKKKL